MPRLLGRYQVPGCCPGTRAGRDPGPDCSGGGSMGARAAKRIEQRDTDREMAEDESWRAAVSRQWAQEWDSPEDAVYDEDAENAAGECHHGCSGSPSCGSERCTFLCHRGVDWAT